MMEHRIKNIVFDVGMVLIDFCWEKACRSHGISEEAIACFDREMIHSIEWNRLDEGTMTEEEAIARFQERVPQYREELERFWSEPERFVEEYPYAAPMIRELKDKGFGVYLLSNYPEHMYQIHWPKFTFLPLVDGYVVSAPEKLAKPDPAIYRLLCDRFRLKPEECMFVDDREENVKAAEGLGMKGVLFRDKQQIDKIFSLRNGQNAI